jgi:hypothetical protein
MELYFIHDVWKDLIWWSKYRAHVIGSHCIRSTTCLESNLSKGMLSPIFYYLNHINILIKETIYFQH